MRRIWITALAIILGVLLCEAQQGVPGGGGPGVPVSGPLPLGYIAPGSYPTVVPQYTYVATLTTGSNTFSVDALTASEISVGMSVISSSFAGGTIVATLAGTTVTTSNLLGSANSTTTGAATVKFVLNRVGATYLGADSILGEQGLFGSAAQGNTTWNYKYNTASDYLYNIPLVSLSDTGKPGAYFAAHTANLTSAGNSSTYGARIDVWNDNPNYHNSAWGLYMQCGVTPTALWSAEYCQEVSPVNYGAAGALIDPYTNNLTGDFDNLRIDAGNGNSGINNISSLLHLIGNGAKSRLGVVVSSDSLDFTSDAYAPAVAMPQDASLTWYSAAGQKAWAIYDTTIGGQNTIVFATNPGTSVYSWDPNNYTNTVGAINHVRTASCSTGAVIVGAGDFSVEVNVMPASGNCAVSLLSSPAVGQQIRISDAVGTAASNYIVITPASGNIDGASTYLITTNFGAWVGEWNGVIWKTVNGAQPSPQVALNRNPDFILDQPQEGASVTPGGSARVTDAWFTTGTNINTPSTIANISFIRQTTGPTGYFNSEKITVGASGDTAGAAQRYDLVSYIEGSVWAQMNWGASGALPINVDFWAEASASGTYCGFFYNSNNNRSYVYSFNIASANVYQNVVVQVPGDTSGTWSHTQNNIGAAFGVGLNDGANYLAPTLATWEGGLYTSASGCTQIGQNANATLTIAAMHLLPGYIEPPYHPREFAQEVDLAQEFYVKSCIAGTKCSQKSSLGSVGAQTLVAPFSFATNTNAGNTVMFPRRMYANNSGAAPPTVTFFNPVNSNAKCYDSTQTADEGVATATNVGDSSFFLTCPLVSGDLAGDIIEVQFVADSNF